MSPLAEPHLFIAAVATGVLVGSALAVYALIYAIGRRERARRNYRYTEGP